MPDIATQSKVLYVATAEHAAAEISPGDDYKVLMAASGEASGVIFKELQKFVLTKSADQTAAAAEEDITWDTEAVDDESLHSGSNAHVTIAAAGWYLIVVMLYSTASAGAAFLFKLVQDSTVVIEALRKGSMGSIYTVLELAATDTLKVRMQGATASTTVIEKDYTYFCGIRLGSD